MKEHTYLHINIAFSRDFYQMSGSSHIRSVLIEYRNCRRTLDVYLVFAILSGQIKSKLNYRLVTYKLASP